MKDQEFIKSLMETNDEDKIVKLFKSQIIEDIKAKNYTKRDVFLYFTYDLSWFNFENEYDEPCFFYTLSDCTFQIIQNSKISCTKKNKCLIKSLVYSSFYNMLKKNITFEISSEAAEYLLSEKEN